MPVSVDLGKSLEAFITQLVSEGRYGSKSEVLREGARLVQEREAYFQSLLSEPVAAIGRGDGLDAETVFGKFRNRVARNGQPNDAAS